MPGLGPKRVKTLYHELDVQTLPQLYKAAREGRIRALPGFGEKTETNILQATEAHLAQPRRCKLAVAAQYADALVDYLRKTPGVRDASLREASAGMRETVGDIDILVDGGRRRATVTARFVAYPEVKERARERAHALERGAAIGPAGRPAGRGAGELRRRAALLHRLEGAQHRGAANRAGARA